MRNLFEFFMVVLDLAKGLSEQIPNKKPLPYCYANFFEKNLGPGRIYALVYIYPMRWCWGNCSRAINRRYITDQRVWKVRNKFKGRHTLYVCLLDNNAVYRLLPWDKEFFYKNERRNKHMFRVPGAYAYAHTMPWRNNNNPNEKM